MRSFADRAMAPWYILSAEYGLVQPEEWLSPYELALGDTSSEYRRAWGEWVAARLERLSGPLRGREVELHAGRAYIDPLRIPLEERGASLICPLEGLRYGERLRWYNSRVQPQDDEVSPAESVEDDAVRRLSDPDATQSPEKWLRTKDPDVKVPGLYSWWVDVRGASELTRGLGLRIRPGLIYAGQAGATRWPSGKRSTSTLWSRLKGMHLGKSARFSTFRLSLGAITAGSHSRQGIDEAALTAWMHKHLSLIAIPVPDAELLGQVERDVLALLDPPLNLQGMESTPIRRRLKELRKQHGVGTLGSTDPAP